VTAQAQTMALLKGWTPLIALQVEYSLLQREVEGEIAPMARDLGMTLVPWSPLKNGFLSGKYQRNAQVSDSERAKFVGGPSEDDFKVIDVVTDIAEQHGSTAAAVSLAWLKAKGAVPIIGARKLEHLESNLEEVTLTPEQIYALDDVSKPNLNYPAPLHGELRAMLQFAGTTVDGEPSGVYPPLLQSSVRY
jgi:aryl-alcohol dehydrogenase-like predicted oxidoreductase